MGAHRLFDLHDALIIDSSRRLHARYLNAEQARTQIATAANTMVRRTILLLVVAGILALVCGILTVRYTWRLINEIEEQSSELNRVSWQLVHSQELTARRLAHELHDALGQTLAALRANLIVLKRNVGAEAHRVSDSLELVDEAISSTREMAHLMRPSILDDFGLDASLSWLAEKFTQRTQIQVSYESEFTERLPDESETHLFRIAQEALTNISRHAQASRVSIRLWPDDGRRRLSIRDNGVGLPESTNSRKSSLGLNGMRARARMLGGELALGRPQGGGTAVEVWIPLSGEVYGSKNSHSLGG